MLFLTVYLNTLGKLFIKNTDFSEKQSLLLLVFIALEGPLSRNKAMDIFWPFQLNKTKKVKSLSESLNRLNKIDPYLVRKYDGILQTDITVDILDLKDAFETKAYQRVIDLYGGLFLLNIEKTKRWRIGEELEEWINEKRKEYQDIFVTSCLIVLEIRFLENNKLEIAEIIKRVIELPADVRVLTFKELTQLQKIAQTNGLYSLIEAIEQYSQNEYDRSLKDSYVINQNLFGRSQILLELTTALISGEDLLVLWGLGGIGKTALAKELLHRLRPIYDDVVFIGLEKISIAIDEKILATELALALGLSFKQKTVVFRAVGYSKILFVFDHLEQTSNIVVFFREFLEACPNIQIVVSARSRLNFGRQFLLTSLEPQTSALDLLNQEIRRIGLEPKNFDTTKLIELCEELGGLPLAIKLAAPWLSSQTVDELIGQVRVNIAFLDIASNQSLGSLIKTSQGLLSPKELSLLRDMVIFADSFDFAAAKAVIGLGFLDLRKLVDSALLVFSNQDGRYSFHSIVRATLGSSQNKAKAHAIYYLELLTENHPQELQVELANIEKAWRFAAKNELFDELEQALPALRWMADSLTMPDYALDLCKLIALDNCPERLHALVLATKAWLYLRSGNYTKVSKLASAALSLESSLKINLMALNALGAAYDLQGEFDKAKDSFTKALELADSHIEKNSALLNLAVNSIHRGEISEAKDLLEILANKELIRWGFLDAKIDAEKNRYRALAKLRKLFETAKKGNNKHWLIQINNLMATIYLKMGQAKVSKELLLDSLDRANKFGLARVQLRVLVLLGDYHISQRNYLEAKDYYLNAFELLMISASIPAILAWILRVIQSKQLSNKFEKPLYAYCLNNQSKLFYEDLNLLKTAKQEIKQEDHKVLITLDPLEVAQLVVLNLENQPPPVS